MFPLKNNAENDAGRLVLELFLFLKKVLYEVKVSGLQLSFNIYIYISIYIYIAFKLAYDKIKLYQSLEY